MGISFWIIAAWVLGSALFSALARNVVHSIFAGTFTFLGVAALYLHLDAEFLGLAQMIVYAGAVSILMVFTLLLARSSGSADPGDELANLRLLVRTCVVAGVVMGVLVASVALTEYLVVGAPADADFSIQKLGMALMEPRWIPSLLLVGVLLTAALVGSLVIATPDTEDEQ